jgi:hypothetical protein
MEGAQQDFSNYPQVKQNPANETEWIFLFNKVMNKNVIMYLFI